MTAQQPGPGMVPPEPDDTTPRLTIRNAVEVTVEVADFSGDARRTEPVVLTKERAELLLAMLEALR